MTHDELLQKIKIFYERKTLGAGKFYIALRAVVELHKPFETTPPWEYVKYMACDACESWTTDGTYYLPYPCPTIQAITGQLG